MTFSGKQIVLGAGALAVLGGGLALALPLSGVLTVAGSHRGLRAEMGMPVPQNSIPMKGGQGPFGLIDMGGMFTMLKVRETPERDGGGWYRHRTGTVASVADPRRLAADGIDPNRALE